MKFMMFRNTGIKRQIAALLSAAMVLTGMSLPAFASEDISADYGYEESLEPVSQEAPEEEAVFEEALDTIEEAGVADEETPEVLDSKEDDIVTSSEEDADVVTPLNGGEYDIVTPLNGGEDDIVTPLNANPSKADLESFVFQGAPLQFDESYKKFSAEFKDGNVKLKYKIPGAVKYSIARVFNVNTGAGVTVLKDAVADNFKKKNYIDEDVFNGIGLYVVEGYDSSGASVGKYVTIPKTYIMEGRAYGKTVQLTFAAVGYGADYTVWKSAYKNFRDDIHETVSGGQLTYGSVAGRKSYTYVDTAPAKELSGTHNTKKKMFYKVQVSAKVNIAGLNQTISSKKTNRYTVQGTRYEAPIVISMNGIPEHEDGCYAGATIWFTDPAQSNGDYLYGDEIKKSSVTVEVYMTEDGKTHKKVASIKGNSLKKETVDKQVRYGIDVSKLLPERHNSYSVMFKKNGKSSARSNLYPYYFHFDQVWPYTIENVNAKTVRLKWYSEQCATKYVVYRTTADYTSVSAAYIAMEAARQDVSHRTDVLGRKTLKRLGLKKVKVFNNNKVTGALLSQEINKLANGKIYGFMIVPMNEDKYGYEEAAVMAIQSQIASPKSLKLTSKGRASFTLKWEKVYKAGGYVIERLEAEDQSVLDNLYGDEDWQYWGTISGNSYLRSAVLPSSQKSLTITSGNGSTIETAKPGVSYAYRVLSVNGDRLTLPIEDVFVIGAIGPKPVKSLKAAIVTRKDDDVVLWDNNKSNKYNISGNRVGHRPVKVSFTAQDKGDTEYYEIGKSFDGGFNFEYLGKLTKGTGKDGMTFKEKSNSIFFYDDNLTRGVQYAYRVRPVASDGTKGAWKVVDFFVVNKIYMYAKSNSLKNSNECTSKKYAYNLNDKSVYRFYIDFWPKAPALTAYKVALPSFLKEVERGTEEINGVKKHYVDVQAVPGKTGTNAIIVKYKYPYDEVEGNKMKSTFLYVSVGE